MNRLILLALGVHLVSTSYLFSIKVRSFSFLRTIGIIRYITYHGHSDVPESCDIGFFRYKQVMCKRTDTARCIRRTVNGVKDEHELRMLANDTGHRVLPKLFSLTDRASQVQHQAHVLRHIHPSCDILWALHKHFRIIFVIMYK